MKTLKEALISKDKIKWATTKIDQSGLKAKDYYVFYSVDIEILEKMEKRFKDDFQILKWPEKFNTTADKESNYKIRLVPKNKINEIVGFYMTYEHHPLYLYRFKDYQTIGDFLKDWAKEDRYYNYINLLERCFDI